MTLAGKKIRIGTASKSKLRQEPPRNALILQREYPEPKCAQTQPVSKRTATPGAKPELLPKDRGGFPNWIRQGFASMPIELPSNKGSIVCRDQGSAQSPYERRFIFHDPFMISWYTSSLTRWPVGTSFWGLSIHQRP